MALRALDSGGRDCRVPWKRPRRHWFTGFLNPQARRPTSLIIRLMPSVPASVMRVRQNASISDH